MKGGEVASQDVRGSIRSKHTTIFRRKAEEVGSGNVSVVTSHPQRSQSLCFIAVVALLTTAMNVAFTNVAVSSASCTSSALQFALYGWAPATASTKRSTPDITAVDSERTILSTSRAPSSAIFYNIFIDPRETANGIRIIEEQTQQMLQILSERDQSIPTLYYNMIGYNYSERFCPSNMTCRLNNYYPKAFEEVTLQDLHHYCQSNPLDIVYYLHNKGSYTPENRVINERWRVSLTDFIFRHATTFLMEDSKRPKQYQGCNSVGEAWNPHNFWHFPGNFWSAKCSYVRNLLPPKDYYISSSRMIINLLSGVHKIPSSPHFCLASYIRTMHETQPLWANLVIGMDRFIYEKWISSHPDIVPCDSHDTIFNTTFLMFDATPHTKEWSHKHRAYRYDWKRMYGRLYEFQYLYGKVPENTSFFWKYYRGTETPSLPSKCQDLRKRNQTTYPIL